MDTIDLSKDFYSWSRNIYSSSRVYYGNVEYKVSNLNENKFVYFKSDDLDNYIKYSNYYAVYYPDEEFPPKIIYNNCTNIEIFNIKTNETHKDVSIFEFQKDTE